VKKWTKKRVFQLALKNIENFGDIYGDSSTCEACHEADSRRGEVLNYPSGACYYCPLWDLYPMPENADCCLIQHKNKSLRNISSQLRGKKGALRALARKVFLG